MTKSVGAVVPDGGDESRLKFVMVDAADVPKRLDPRSRQWAEIVDRCIKTGHSACITAAEMQRLRKNQHSISVSISNYVRRHREAVKGYRMRMRAGKDGELYISAEKVKTPAAKPARGGQHDRSQRRRAAGA